MPVSSARLLKFRVFALLVLTSLSSSSAVIFNSGITALTAADPIQLGRLSRSGVPSDWSTTPKPFPGVLNPNSLYRYTSFTVPASPFSYLQISFYDDSGFANVFSSAYLNSYQPNTSAANRGLDVNYLGDAGLSGSPFGNSGVFQVVLTNPSVNRLNLVVNETAATGAGTGQNFEILVEGFYTTDFNDTTPPVPEPASAGLALAGCVITGFLALRKARASNP